MCRVMGVTPYSDGVDLISELCNVAVEESTAEAIVQEVGGRIRAAEQQRVDNVKLRLERATQERLMVEVPEGSPVPALETRPVEGNRIYFGVDALTAHIDGDWHNVQNGVVFTVEKDKDGRDTLLKREYLAGQMDSARAARASENRKSGVRMSDSFGGVEGKRGRLTSYSRRGPCATY